MSHNPELLLTSPAEESVAYLAIKPAKIDEPRAGQIPSIAMVNTQDRVQSECGDHGGKELERNAHIITARQIQPSSFHTIPKYPPWTRYPGCAGDKWSHSPWTRSGQAESKHGLTPPLTSPLPCGSSLRKGVGSFRK